MTFLSANDSACPLSAQEKGEDGFLGLTRRNKSFDKAMDMHCDRVFFWCIVLVVTSSSRRKMSPVVGLWCVFFPFPKKSQVLLFSRGTSSMTLSLCVCLKKVYHGDGALVGGYVGDWSKRKYR